MNNNLDRRDTYGKLTLLFIYIKNPALNVLHGRNEIYKKHCDDGPSAVSTFVHPN